MQLGGTASGEGGGDESPLAAPREVRIGAGTAWGLGGQVLGLGTSLVIGVLVARLLGIEGKGALAVVLQVVGIMLAVLNLGVGGANVYFVAKGRVAPGTAVANSALMAALLGLVGAPVLAVLLYGRFAVVEGISVATIIIAALAVPLGLLASWLIGVSAGLGDLRLPFFYALASSLTTLAALGALLLAGSVDITWVVAASVAGSVVGTVVVLIGLRRSIWPVHANMASARLMAGYSARTHLAGVAGYLHNRQDMLILGWLAGAGAVGLYSVGVSLAELMWYVPSALGAAILAKAPHSSDASAHDYVSRSTRIAVLFTVVTAFIGAVSAPWLIRAVYGTSFAPAALAFYLLLPGAFADGVMRPAWSYFASRERIFWREATGTMVLNIVLNVVLIPRMGFAGAAIASSVSYALLAGIVLTRFVRVTGESVATVLVPTRSDVRISAGTLWDILRGQP